MPNLLLLLSLEFRSTFNNSSLLSLYLTNDFLVVKVELLVSQTSVVLSISQYHNVYHRLRS